MQCGDEEGSGGAVAQRALEIGEASERRFGRLSEPATMHDPAVFLRADQSRDDQTAEQLRDSSSGAFCAGRQLGEQVRPVRYRRCSYPSGQSGIKRGDLVIGFGLPQAIQVVRRLGQQGEIRDKISVRHHLDSAQARQAAPAARSACGKDTKSAWLDLSELLARLIKLAPEGVHRHDVGCTIDRDSHDTAGHLRFRKSKFTCRICDSYADK